MNPLVETESQKELYWKTFDQQRWGFLRWGQVRMKNALDKQVKPVMEALKDSPESAIANLPMINYQPIEDAFMDLYGLVGRRFALQVNDALKSGNPSYRKKQDDEGFFVRLIKDWIRSAGMPRIRGITENTRNHLRQALNKGIDEGMGIEELARLISGSRRIAGIQRARVIARTEIISASNKGSLEGAKKSGMELSKEWISTRDGRTRRLEAEDKFDHYDVDGQTVAMDGKFIIEGRLGSEQLSFPGDPTGSPANVIMCRCTLGYRKTKPLGDLSLIAIGN